MVWKECIQIGLAWVTCVSVPIGLLKIVLDYFRAWLMPNPVAWVTNYCNVLPVFDLHNDNFLWLNLSSFSISTSWHFLLCSDFKCFCLLSLHLVDWYSFSKCKLKWYLKVLPSLYLAMLTLDSVENSFDSILLLSAHLIEYQYQYNIVNQGSLKSGKTVAKESPASFVKYT